MMNAILWTVYFITTVLGYVGMKFASTAGEARLSLAPFFHPWGIAAMSAWMVSGLVWPWILAKESLAWANAFSSLRVILITAAAVLFVGETVNTKQIMGIILIMIGVALAK